MPPAGPKIRRDHHQTSAPNATAATPQAARPRASMAAGSLPIRLNQRSPTPKAFDWCQASESSEGKRNPPQSSGRPARRCGRLPFSGSRR